MKKLVFLFLIVHSSLMGQTALLDSLLNSKNDTLILEAYNRMAFNAIFNDKDSAIKALRKAHHFSATKHLDYGFNVSLNNLGIYFDVNGEADSAKIYFEKSLEFSRKNKFKIHESSSLNSLGMYYWNKGNYEEALNYFFKALRLGEEMPIDKRNTLDNYLNNIGLIYQEMQLYKKALRYHEKALKIRIENKNYKGQASSFNNIGICYTNFGDQDKAIESFKKGMKTALEANEKVVYYNNSQGLAKIRLLQDKPNLALELFLDSYNRPAKVSFNSKSKVALLESISKTYISLKDANNAIKYGLLAAEEIEASGMNKTAHLGIYNWLAQAYFLKGDFEKGAAYNNQFYEATTTKFKEENSIILQELEAKYETEKKEMKIAQQHEEILKNTLAIKNKNLLVLGITSLLLILAIVAFGISKKHQLNRKQLQKELALKDTLATVQTQNKLQQQRISISRDLHDNIGAQLTFIISSLDNLKYFEFTKERLYQKFDFIGEFTRQTITELRDTIWAINKLEITVDDLKARIANFINHANISSNGIDFEFKFLFQEAQQNGFNSIVGINIYRIIQEAVNNAIKHSNASKILVFIDKEDEKLNILIKDNGIGFDQAIVAMGNGLNNMKKRAKEIGGDLEINQLEQGTEIKLILVNA